MSEEDQVSTLLGSLARSFATLVTSIEPRMEGFSLDYVQQALIHEEMKQSEVSRLSSGAESALTGSSEDVRHAIGQHVLDVVMWVIFAVIVQKNSNCTKQR